jgi:hypothetical protein
MRDIRDAAAEEEQAPIFTHPDTIITSAALHREDLLATAAHERQAATVANPAMPWHMLAIRVAVFVALFLGVRG